MFPQQRRHCRLSGSDQALGRVAVAFDSLEYVGVTVLRGVILVVVVIPLLQNVFARVA